MDGLRKPVWILLAILAIAAGAAWTDRWWTGGARHPRVLLIGIDGADPLIVERLIAQHKLPTFARLQREGALGRLRSREPLLSPLLWTTIATGRKPQDHGVLDFVEAASDGQVIPITSSRRRVPALWNIATQFGHSSGFVGWYASFPVEQVRGFEVSDRIAFHQVASAHVGGGATAPAELASALRRRFGDPAADLDAVRARFVATAAVPLSADGERRVSQLARMYATTEYYRHATIWLQAAYRPEVLGVYFELVDACSHLFMENAPPRRTGTADADDQAFAQTVDRCYAYQDEVIADIVSIADDETLIIICSDHGFKSGDRRPDTPGRADDGQAALWHQPNGIVLIRGRSVEPGSTIRDATVLDVAPTVLRALDVPLAHDLAGKPIEEAFGRARSIPPRAKIARYDFVPVPPPQPGAAAAPEKLAELRALGYLTGSSDAPRPTDGGRFAASFVNEGVALYVDGEYRDALRAFEKAVELDPRNVNARAFAARIQLERRELAAARQLLDQAAALNPRSAYVRLLRANLAITARDWEAADRDLAAAAALDARLPMLYVQRARLQNARHDPAAALESLQSAERLTDAEPMLLDILMLRADAFTVLGRPGDAAAALARAAELAPPDRIASARADLALGRDDAASAIGYLRAALERTPQAARLWAILGAAYGEGGNYDAAIDAYQRSVSIEPTALACKTLAALLFEIRHDRARARELWEQSLALDRRQPDVQRFLSQYDFSR